MRQHDTIIVDWGTTNFRAYRFDGHGELRDEHRAAAGILSVPDRSFEAALQREIGHWISADSRLLLSGMITSRNGWVETTYIEAPARLPDLAREAVRQSHASGASLLFLPGVAMGLPAPDVMRGEEIQVFGVCAEDEEATVVLPGTHSKWVRHGGGRILAFHTFMTGEIYAALRDHTILGRLAEPGTSGSRAAFLDGVRHMRGKIGPGLLHAAFAARSRVLFGALPPADVTEFLSGIVIGGEFAGGLALGWDAGPIRLVGEAALVDRYAAAAAEFGLVAERAASDATVLGFCKLAALEETAT